MMAEDGSPGPELRCPTQAWLGASLVVQGLGLLRLMQGCGLLLVREPGHTWLWSQKNRARAAEAEWTTSSEH